MKLARIKKDRSTPEKDKFWTSAEEAIQEINSWPAWKQSYLSPILTRDQESGRILLQEAKPQKKKK
jgi:hypothetical protein